jgi:hypothetical protein
MNRTLVATRIQLVTNWRWSLAFPVALLGFILLINIVVGLIAGSPGFTTGGLTAAYIIAATTQLTAMTQFFPFSLGLSLTRREFYAGTWLFVLVQSMFIAVVLAAALAVERATGGWGARLGFFRFGVPDDANPFVAALIFVAVLLAASGAGAVFGIVFKRYGQLGVWVVILGLVLALTATAAYIGWRQAWPQVIGAFADPSTAALIGYPLLVAVVLAGAGWLGLRRATP